MRNITNQDVVDYLDELFTPVSNELEEMRVNAESRNIPVIQRETERLLISLLEMNKPKRILEIGTAVGYSAAVFAKVRKGAEIITLEKSKPSYEEALQNIDKLNLKSDIQVIFGDAKDMINLLGKENKNIEPFDFVFIDAAKSHYMNFWNDIKDITKKGSVIFCDNVLMRAMTVDKKYDTHDKHRTNIKNMRAFLEYITNLEDVDTSVLPVGDGVSISYKKR